jgi:hypothetical protein
MTFAEICASAVNPGYRLKLSTQRSFRRALQTLVRESVLITTGNPFRYFLHPMLVIGTFAEQPDAPVLLAVLEDIKAESIKAGQRRPRYYRQVSDKATQAATRATSKQRRPTAPQKDNMPTCNATPRTNSLTIGHTRPPVRPNG